MDPDFAKGFGVRPYIWEMSAGVQHELLPGVALTGMYYRKLYGNFQVTQNRAVSPSDYSPYSVTAPSDPRLPNGGNYLITGLYDLNPNKVGQADNLLTSSEKFGGQIQHWNGVDLLVNARVGKGASLQGGLSTGKTTFDNCEIASKVGGIFGGAAVGAAIGNPSTQFCHVETPFLSSVRLSGAYPLPWETMVSTVVQTNPGPEIQAGGTFVNAQIFPSLGRNLSSGTSTTIPLISAGTMFNNRLNQLDLRFSKNLTVGKTRWQGTFDIYNAWNSSVSLAQNNTYGTNGARWQLPTVVMVGRLLKFGVRVSF
jgi:hypothetical protein